MSIIRHVEADASRRAEERKDNLQSYTRVFHVVTSEDNVVEQVILDDPRTPRYGSPHPDKPSAICISVDIEKQTARAWLVTARYTTQPPDKPETMQLPPWGRPSLLQWSTVLRQITRPADVTGKAFLNPAGDPFDPPPVMQKTLLHLTIDRNQLSFDPQLVLEYTNTVNSDKWLGFEPTEVKCAGATATQRHEGSTTYWNVIWSFDIWKREHQWYFKQDWKAWNPIEILNAGPRYIKINADGEEVLTIADDEWGTAHSGAVLLNRDGGKLGRLEKPTYTLFQLYEEKPFAALMLP